MRWKRKAMQPLREGGGLEMVAVETSGGPLLVPYEIRRSPCGRRIRLSIGPQNQALLRVPAHGSIRDALGFLRSQGDWLERQMRKTPAPVALDEHLKQHPRLSGLGREFVVTLNFTLARPFLVYSEKSGEVEFRYPAGEGGERALGGLLRQFAEKVLPPRVRELAGRHGLPIRRVSVRDQGTRWGSCAASGTVSLNWRLVLLPVELHDHVLWHELAHVTEMNHAESFWNLLRYYDSSADQHDRGLTRVSRVLMRLGRR
jgi:predicted metal-dependent hydrolase